MPTILNWASEEPQSTTSKLVSPDGWTQSPTSGSPAASSPNRTTAATPATTTAPPIEASFFFLPPPGAAGTPGGALQTDGCSGCGCWTSDCVMWVLPVSWLDESGDTARPSDRGDARHAGPEPGRDLLRPTAPGRFSNR